MKDISFMILGPGTSPSEAPMAANALVAKCVDCPQKIGGEATPKAGTMNYAPHTGVAIPFVQCDGNRGNCGFVNDKAVNVIDPILLP